MPPSNQAAWMSTKKTRPFKITNAPYTPPGPNQVVIKNTAVAINPFDWVLQFIGPILASYLSYPCILGTDVAGYVVEVGKDVKRFKIGDRVFGSAAGIDKNVNNAAEGGFQLYTVMREYMISSTPSHITDEQACVLGLGVGTAAYGLFHPKYLGLEMPSITSETESVEQGKRVVIVTGGSSSVGSNAIQLAVLAGYRVISTSSPKNFEYVKKLGASHVFDYNSQMIVRDMLDVLDGFQLVGAYVIGKGAVEICTEVMMRHDAKSTRKRIALAGAIIPAEQLVSCWGQVSFVISMVGDLIKSSIRQRRTGIEAKFIMLDDLVDSESVVAQVYQNYLPSALEARRFVPAPPPQVVGHGLEKIQEALEIQRLGVSGRKLVVTL
ncbi:hypothetical protein PENSTE_c013G01584 [Penicillium steckii]|uniref:Enoyl reductase (ER) domain-containing protein n=1 Tax=Penicillium steckii TaxID=303698 RepID=A0A1V6T3M9_9EURO|nr:hypothetical protein PENSTE_c013G01584 [Penicillium steckii]